MQRISVVINTLNNEFDIKRTINSASWADEILVCDMHSSDKTLEIAKKLGAKAILHKRLKYVEPARNFAINKASSEWILILDPDEEINEELKNRLTKISAGTEQIDYVRIPRKNIIFGKWIQNSGWWPDYNIRFFKKGKVSWSDKIHKQPQASGLGLDLPAEEKWAITHNHYKNVTEYLERMIRYTRVQAEELKKEGLVFEWKDLIIKPFEEFLSRFFANKGYLDGIHGLVLSILQAFSQFVLYIRLWELQSFKEADLNLNDVKEVGRKTANDLDYWLKNVNLSNNPFERFAQKLKGKF